MEIKNKKAYYNYTISNEYEAGISLVGTEIKSIRKGSVNISDSYIRIKNNEAYIINMFVEKYDSGSIFNHETNRERKLLLHKKEIPDIQPRSTMTAHQHFKRVCAAPTRMPQYIIWLK